MKNFKQLKIWQNGFQIAVDAINLVKKFPNEEKYALCSQITRSAVSIPSNIAEGSSRSSHKDYSRYVEIALGSSFELETQLLISQAVNYGDSEQTQRILQNLDEEQKMIMSFLNKLQ